MEEVLVSIVMPAYNCSSYIEEAIVSVLEQTYSKWELIVVDDCSTDNTAEIAEGFSKRDSRIKVIKLEKNSGAAIARNTAVEIARGTFIAYLDSDDLWKKEKLEMQLRFMLDNNYLLTCTSYGKVDEESRILNMEKRCKKIYNYNDVLCECPGNSTVMYNVDKIGKVYGEDIKRRNDFVVLLKTVKIAEYVYGLDKVLGFHRIRPGSISVKKNQLLTYQWYVYRKIEKLSICKSLYLILLKIYQTISGKNG